MNQRDTNPSNFIIYIFIILTLAMVVSISFVRINNIYSDLEKEIVSLKYNYYKDKKSFLKNFIQNIDKIIEYNDKNGNSKEDSLNFIRYLNTKRTKGKYVYVVELNKLAMSNRGAKVLIHPLLPQLEGKILDPTKNSEERKKNIKQLIKDTKKYGESFLIINPKSLLYKTTSPLLFYTKINKNYNWMIGTGISIESIETQIAKKQAVVEEKVQKDIKQTILLFVLFLSIAILISFYISKKINMILNKYKQTVHKNEIELENINKELESKIEEEIEKNRQKEQVLIEKSKFISLGEMISNIAHQWRQPLSELSAILMYIKFRYDFGSLDKETMELKLKESENVIQFMSKTIDDFRYFFMPSKGKEKFILQDAVDAALSIISSSLENLNIDIKKYIIEDIEIYSYLNEYEQVILNIMNNAKDVLVQKKVLNPKIKIIGKCKNDMVILIIEDNGGGIEEDVLPKIFEPYFSTKCESEGTGIGLYMSKIIIEKNMKGSLSVENTKQGAKFLIVIPKILD